MLKRQKSYAQAALGELKGKVMKKLAWKTLFDQFSGWISMLAFKNAKMQKISIFKFAQELNES